MTKTNNMAITSMILAILSIFLFWLPLIGIALLITSLILGIKSLKTISNNKKQSGKGFAITGIVISIILIIPSLIFMISGLFYFQAFSFDKTIPTTCSFDSELECGTEFSLNSNGNLNIQLKNNNDQDITLKSINIIEKSLENSGSKCLANIDKTLSPGNFENINVNFEDTGCGISENKGFKKTYTVNIEYFFGTSLIPMISYGELTTTVN